MHYIPPDIYSRRDVDASVDIWALEVVAMQLAHGPPWAEWAACIIAPLSQPLGG